MISVGRGNVDKMNHKGEVLTVVFLNQRTYQYYPVSEKQYNKLLASVAKPGSEEFKKKFAEIKNNPNIKYQEI